MISESSDGVTTIQPLGLINYIHEVYVGVLIQHTASRLRNLMELLQRYKSCILLELYVIQMRTNYIWTQVH